jgi:hypothetical protein
MWTDIACRAFRERLVLELRYYGYSRCIEMHAVSYSKRGASNARLAGPRGERWRERVGWKLMKLAEANGASVSDEPSNAPRPGYKRGEAAMARIICEV